MERGLHIFESMRGRYGIEPGAEHYACIEDLLGRSGLVNRAYECINRMPILPTIYVWEVPLKSCKMHGKTKLGEIAAKKLFQLDPDDFNNHVVFSNMLASAGR